MRTPFLTARWERLLFLNYRCPTSLLEPFVPAGTTLDFWKGEALVSLVGFLFQDTRVRGFPIPFHRNFEEVNLRFYVRHTTPDGEIRRGVVFIRELVPRSAIALVARTVYNEPYLAVPMRHRVDLDLETGGSVEYGWTYRDGPCTMAGTVLGPPAISNDDSEATFITEHFWGYTRQRDGSTLEYEVAHPQWPLWTAETSSFVGEVSALYGPAFQPILERAPQSAFLAVGSPVSVFPGRRL